MKHYRIAGLLWIAGILAAIPFMAWLSWKTTAAQGEGELIPSHWKCQVVTTDGNPVPHARMDIVPRSGSVWNPSFQNARDDGSLTAGADGVVELTINGRPRFGVRWWYLFWIFPIDTIDGPEAQDLRFSAEGYESAFVPLSKVTNSEGEMSVTLHPKKP